MFSKFLKLKKDRLSNEIIFQNLSLNINIYEKDLFNLLISVIMSSVGLNMNSIPLIIGSMLISPLMIPILGISYSYITQNYIFMKKAYFYLSLQIFISIFISMIYFLISPLDILTQEIIMRTNPTVWDVLIAFVGGIAIALALIYKGNMNIISGISIGTSLIPPLCVSGYGLSILNFSIFFSSLYLFFINSFFIGFGSILIFKFFKIRKIELINKKNRNFMIIFTIIIMIPSVLFAHNLVKKTIIENQVNNFISNEITNTKNRVVSKKNIDLEDKTISFFLIGKYVDEIEIKNLEKIKNKYNLSDFKFIFYQNNNLENLLTEKNLLYFKKYLNLDGIDIKKLVLEKKEKEEIELEKIMKKEKNSRLIQEFKIIFSNIENIKIYDSSFDYNNSEKEKNKLVIIETIGPLDLNEEEVIKKWLNFKLNEDIEIIYLKKL